MDQLSWLAEKLLFCDVTDNLKAKQWPDRKRQIMVLRELLRSGAATFSPSKNCLESKSALVANLGFVALAITASTASEP